MVDDSMHADTLWRSQELQLKELHRKLPCIPYPCSLPQFGLAEPSFEVDKTNHEPRATSHEPRATPTTAAMGIQSPQHGDAHARYPIDTHARTYLSIGGDASPVDSNKAETSQNNTTPKRLPNVAAVCARCGETGHVLTSDQCPLYCIRSRGK